MQRVFKALATLTFVALALIQSTLATSISEHPQESPPAQAKRTLPDEIVLAKDSKLGRVVFHHANHATKAYNIAGTGPISCIECHHTAQPASEVVKHAPLKTAWPLDRTTTLSLDLLNKDDGAVGVIACRSCHAPAGTKPIVWPEIPSIKHESSAAMITLTNQQAFHRNCSSCHDEVAKGRADVKAPGSKQCMECHKK